MPFEDNSFDFIFSEQVLEHVVPDIIEDYYSEEARVLSPEGICYHIAPHRIRLYDSHSKTWLIHYLLRRLWLWFLARSGRDASSHEVSLFLRTRYFHFSRLRRYFDSFEDVTLERILDYDRTQNFDGPKGVRNRLDSLIRNRFTGILMRPLARFLFSFSTVACRKTELS